MRLERQGTELSVAILMDDLNAAKEISSALRSLDLFCHHYQSLDEFWAASQIQLPDLLILDLTKMSFGEIQFKNHPKVKDGSLSYVFLMKDTTKVLLSSTLNLRPYAYLQMDLSLGQQLEGIVIRKLRELTLTKEIRELEQRVQRLQSRSQRMINEKNEAEEFKSNFELIKKITKEVEANSLRSDFIGALSQGFETWDMVKGYGFYELGYSGQKLVSPGLRTKKNHPFPSLWLGQLNLNGIEKFAEDMAIQVAEELFEEKPFCLRIFGGSKKPDLLIFISVSATLSESFSWELLAFMLSGVYRELKIQSTGQKQISNVITSWEALDLLDKLSLPQSDCSQVRVLALSLLPVCDLVRSRMNNTFYWSAFFQEMNSKLHQALQKKTKISLLAPWHFLIFIDKDDLELEFNVLQNLIKQIPVWKFFEDDSQIFTKDVYPKIKLIPNSSVQYLRGLFSELDELNSLTKNNNFFESKQTINPSHQT